LSNQRGVAQTFVAKWREGFQNVYGVRLSSDTDSPARKWLTGHFYRLFRAFSEIDLPEGAGDLRHSIAGRWMR
jgi:hypothetical protein